MVEDKTQIQISVKNRDKLLKLGNKGETYNEVITRIISKFENGK